MASSRPAMDASLYMLRWVDPIPELKRQLASELVRVTDGWTPTELGFFMGVDQPRVSDLRRGKLDRFSVESLIRFLKRMDHSVQFTVTRDQRFARCVSKELADGDRSGAPAHDP